MSDEEKTLSERHAEAVERHRTREEAKAQKQMAHELLGLELVERFEKDLGTKDEQFKMVDLGSIGEGFVVVKLGESLYQKKLEQAVASLKKGQTLSDADLEQYVNFCVVYPPIVEFRALCNRRPNVLSRTANALAYLFGQAREADESKF